MGTQYKILGLKSTNLLLAAATEKEMEGLNNGRHQWWVSHSSPTGLPAGAYEFIDRAYDSESKSWKFLWLVTDIERDK